MIDGFNTKNEHAALAALVVYGCYKSRDTNKMKVTPDFWGIIERGVKSSSKRSSDLNDFIEKFKKKISCSTIKPKYMTNLQKQPEILVSDGNGGFISKKNETRGFWLDKIEEADNRQVLEKLYKQTSFIIILVRDRIEREKLLIEANMMQEDNEDE